MARPIAGAPCLCLRMYRGSEKVTLATMENRKFTGAAGWIAAASIAAAMPAAYAQTPSPAAASTSAAPDATTPATTDPVTTAQATTSPATTAPPPAGAAPAAPAAAPAAPAPAAPPPGLWIDGIHLSAQLRCGDHRQPVSPGDRSELGTALFTDHANQVQLNQLLLTANKPLDPKNPDYQWGFKVQFMYGSDARYTQFLGELNRVDPEPALSARCRRGERPGASAVAHRRAASTSRSASIRRRSATRRSIRRPTRSTRTPTSSSSACRSSTPARWRRRMSMTCSISTAVSTPAPTQRLGPLGDNNGAIGGIGGFNLTFLGGNLTILALTHFGPEDATRALSPLGINANGQWRFFNDVLVTYKASDTWTFVTETNWVRDGYGFVGKAVNGFGLAQYASYALTDTLTLNGRAEYWRDDNNFFVASFPANNSFVQFQQGFPVLVHGAPGSSSTYGALTARRDLEACVASAGNRFADPSRSPLGSRLHQQQSVQQQSACQYQRHAELVHLRLGHCPDFLTRISEGSSRIRHGGRSLSSGGPSATASTRHPR